MCGDGESFRVGRVRSLNTQFPPFFHCNVCLEGTKKNNRRWADCASVSTRFTIISPEMSTRDFHRLRMTFLHFCLMIIIMSFLFFFLYIKITEKKKKNFHCSREERFIIVKMGVGREKENHNITQHVNQLLCKKEPKKREEEKKVIKKFF